MKRPSPAFVLACVALFVALGGTGYAALQLPKNSVGSKQIKKGAVKTSEIANNAVTGAKVRGGSLTASDFQAGSLPRGEKGERGERGPAGPAGLTGPAGSARAYGYVAGDGTLNPARSRGGATVTHPFTGRYCIAIPGVTPASGVMTVDLDFNNSATMAPPPDPGDAAGFVEVDYTAPGCAPGEFRVNAIEQQFDAVTGAHIGNEYFDQPFAFVVP